MKTYLIIISLMLLAYLQVEAQDNTTSTASELAFVETPMPLPNEKFQLSNIIPVSASEQFVKVQILKPLELKVKVFTMNGVMALEETHDLQSGTTQVSLNFSTLQSGYYMVQFYTQDGSALRRYIKK